MTILQRPDIRRFAAGNDGLPYVFLYESGAAGPSVTVLALTHGNEIAGAWVMSELLERGLRPERGRLALVFANYQAFGEAADSPRRFVDLDFNRVWDRALLDGPGQAWELQRARELRPIFEKSDYLLDLHTTATDDPAFLISTAKRDALALLEKLPEPSHRIIFEQPLHQGLLLIEACGLSDPDNRRIGLVAECGQHLAPASVAVARSVTLDFLETTAVIGRAQRHALWPQELRSDGQPGPGLPDGARQAARAGSLRFTARQMVLARTSDFRFARSFRSFDRVAADEVFAHDGGEPIRAGFEGAVLLMPRSRPQAGGEAVLVAQSEILAARVTSPQRLISPSM